MSTYEAEIHGGWVLDIRELHVMSFVYQNPNTGKFISHYLIIDGLCHIMSERRPLAKYPI